MNISRTIGRAASVLAVLIAGSSLAGRASAHVRYVTPGSDPVAVVAFLVEALTDPFNLAVLGVGGAASLLAALVYLRIRPLRRDVAVFREAVRGYRDLLPWLLRLSVGLPLVGAGFSGYFFSPVVTPGSPTFVRLFGITVGFLLLFGFGTRLVAFLGLLSYLGGLALYPALFLAFEYVPAFIAIALVGGGRPSADHVISQLADAETAYSRIDPFYRAVAVPFVRRVEPYTALVPVVLRAGLGVSFVYLGVAQKLMNPGDATAVVAKYNLTAVVPVSPELWVVGAGLTEAAVGTVLVFGVFVRAASGVAFLLFTTTLFGLPDDPILAHLSLFGLASALLVTGAGPLSFDAWIRDRERRSTPGPASTSVRSDD